MKSLPEVLFALALFAAVRSIHAGNYYLTPSMFGMIISTGMGKTSIATLAANIYEASKTFKDKFT